MHSFVGTSDKIFLFAVCANLCGQAAEASLERERHTLVETRTDLVKRAEGAEKRCESLQCSTKELTQKLRDAERRFQKVHKEATDFNLTRSVVAVIPS